MKTVRNILLVILVVLTIICFTLFHDQIIGVFKYNVFNIEKEVTINNNTYAKKSSYQFVQLTDNFYAKNYDHLLDILYTVLNSGTYSFSFYCSTEYDNCLNDFESIMADDEIFYSIDNFVHPFNSYQNASYEINDSPIERSITLNFVRLYTNEEINMINEKVDEILDEIIDNSMTDKEKIITVHNYIIKNTSYVKDTDKSYKASTLLFENEGVCSAYTDTMAIFLTEMGLENYRISTKEHIWNLVYVDNTWLHVDTTFDDPVVVNGGNVLLSDMLLINTNRLLELDNVNHNFNQNIFKEAM